MVFASAETSQLSASDGTIFRSLSMYTSGRCSAYSTVIELESCALLGSSVGGSPWMSVCRICSAARSDDGAADSLVPADGCSLAPDAGAVVACEPPQAAAKIANAPARARRRFCNMCDPFHHIRRRELLPRRPEPFEHALSAQAFETCRPARPRTILPSQEPCARAPAVTMTSRGPQDGAYHSHESSTRQQRRRSRLPLDTALSERRSEHVRSLALQHPLNRGMASLRRSWVASAGSAAARRSPRRGA